MCLQKDAKNTGKHAPHRNALVHEYSCHTITCKITEKYTSVRKDMRHRSSRKTQAYVNFTTKKKKKKSKASNVATIVISREQEEIDYKQKKGMVCVVFVTVV